ncbi:hypothetical protein ACFQL4_15360 [Halosimplex aquaticum]
MFESTTPALPAASASTIPTTHRPSLSALVDSDAVVVWVTIGSSTYPPVVAARLPALVPLGPRSVAGRVPSTSAVRSAFTATSPPFRRRR